MAVKFKIEMPAKLAQKSLEAPRFGWVQTVEEGGIEHLVLLSPVGALWFDVNGSGTAAWGSREYFDESNCKILRVFDQDEIDLKIEVKS